jgi:mannose-6-phosphate isomerase-like protein (cupin superfamily)
VKAQGGFTWHKHADTDEFLLALDRRLTIQVRDRSAVLAPRELSVVPRSAEYYPQAKTEAASLLAPAAHPHQHR